MIKKIIKILLVIFIFSFNLINVYSEDYETYIAGGFKAVIEDDADLLTPEEETKLTEEMQSLRYYGNIVLKTINENKYETTLLYATNYYNEKFDNKDGTILLIDLDKKELLLDSYGRNIERLPKEKTQVIIDKYKQYAVNEEYYNCTSNIFSELIDVVSNKPKDIEVTPEVYEGDKYKAVIEDNADLLTDDEEKKLLDEMSELTKYGNIIFKSIASNNTSAESFAREYYHSNYGTESGTLFLIDMDNRKIYIFSDGANYHVITNSKAYIITDNTYRYATNKEYYKCASEAFKEIKTLLDGGKILEPMRYIGNFLLSIVLAFLINFIIIFIASRVRKASDSDMIKTCKVNFQIGNITGKKTGTHRVYNPPSSSSGGSSGGGGGGGGGSSGGGGGHSF